MNILHKFDKILDFIYPDRCIVCDEIIKFGDKSYICGNCISKVKFISSDFCEKCGKQLKPNRTICDDCKKTLHFYENGRSVFVYDGEIKSAILDLKYHNKMYLAHTLGAVMANLYSNSAKWKADAVIAVPSDYDRIVERGYNQSELIAEKFSKFTNIPYKNNIIKKVRKTTHQQLLNRNERMTNLVGSFYAIKIKDIKNIIIIDDVYTTGATVDACAKALIDAGYSKVYFMTVASGVV